MLTALIVWCLKHLFYFHLFRQVFQRLQPAHVDSTLPRMRRVHEVPGSVVAFLHAVYTVGYGYGYWLGLCDLDQLYDCRIISSSYLVFDMMQSFRTHRQQDRRTSSDTAAHPYGVAFHHITTLLLIHGWLCGGSTEVSAMLLYFRSELPVIFLKATWLLLHVGRSNTRACAICSNLTVVTYFLCRVVLFPLVFLFSLAAGMSWLNPLTWPVLGVLALVYLLNLLWFAKLIKRNVRFLPNNTWLRHLTRECVLPQYAACGTADSQRWKNHSLYGQTAAEQSD